MSESFTIAILDPRGGPSSAITPYDLVADATQQNLRIALVSNGFYDATNLVQAVGKLLQDRLPSARITLYERRDPSSVATADVIDQIAADNDVAITALGHCGSCTASATRDAASLARAGIPSCALISEKFLPTSTFVARAAGMPDIPRVKLPYPVAGTGKERIAEIAANALPHILACWEGSHVLAAA